MLYIDVQPARFPFRLGSIVACSYRIEAGSAPEVEATNLLHCGPSESYASCLIMQRVAYSGARVEAPTYARPLGEKMLARERFKKRKAYTSEAGG